MPWKLFARTCVLTLGIALAAGLPGPASSAQEVPAEGVAERAGPDPAAAALPAESPEGHFVFHSDPGVNLHHFLYHLARHGEKEKKLWGRVPIDGEDLAVELEGEEARAWREALDVYREWMEEDLVFGDGVRRRKTLSAAGPEAWAGDETVGKALLRAMPVYQRHWWPRHDRLNRRMHAHLVPLLQRHETELASALAAAFESRWGDEPIRVDLVPYSNWSGAYTSFRPNHVVYSSTDPDLLGDHGLEILFHEAGHTHPLGKPVAVTTREVAEELGVEEGRLWHSILFYATGRAVRRVLGSDYVTYAEAGDMWSRGGMAPHHQPLVRHWDESLPLEERVRRILRAIHDLEDEPAEERTGAFTTFPLDPCRTDLWSVNPIAGLQVAWPPLAERQGVASVEERRRALATWERLPAVVDQEIAALRKGVREGYTAPAGQGLCPPTRASRPPVPLPDLVPPGVVVAAGQLDGASQVADTLLDRTAGHRRLQDLPDHLGQRLALGRGPLLQLATEGLVGSHRDRRTHAHIVLPGTGLAREGPGRDEGRGSSMVPRLENKETVTKV